jgi:hypothetical protein
VSIVYAGSVVVVSGAVRTMGGPTTPNSTLSEAGTSPAPLPPPASLSRPVGSTQFNGLFHA